MAAPLLHDLACVVHLHSTWSDGTGTVSQIVAAGARSGVDVVLLTDHDSLGGLADEGWHGSVLLLVGEEVSPPRRDHTLVFGVEEVLDNRLSGREIVTAAGEGGGLSFAAHPFSRGSTRFQRLGGGMPHTAVSAPDLTGIELWSFVTDTGERLGSIREALRFVARPLSVLRGPPRENVREWERLCRTRRVVALGGLDAHQIGVRVRGRVPLRLMSYARSFRQMRTHVLCSGLPDGSLAHDRALVYDALREGRCYIAVDALAPARGFSYWASDELVMGGEAPFDGQTLHVRLPRPAEIRLLRDGSLLAAVHDASLDSAAERPGVYRVEAWLGRRTWIVSNPIYLRS